MHYTCVKNKIAIVWICYIFRNVALRNGSHACRKFLNNNGSAGDYIQEYEKEGKSYIQTCQGIGWKKLSWCAAGGSEQTKVCIYCLCYCCMLGRSICTKAGVVHSLKPHFVCLMEVTVLGYQGQYRAQGKFLWQVHMCRVGTLLASIWVMCLILKRHTLSGR